MNSLSSLSLSAHEQHLRSWVMIRTLVLLCLITTTLIALWHFSLFTESQSALVTIAAVLILMCITNTLTYFRLQKPLPVTSLEFFIHLLLDLICLSIIFYFSGGANNPFVSYFLVPICIAAATLNGVYVLLITSISIASYSLLLFFYTPLPVLSPSHGSLHLPFSSHAEPFNLHVIGMWINFFISAGLITYFVVKMAYDLRAQKEQINRHREDELRDEQLIAIATLAAGTAHELGTPLSTMKVLISELRDEHKEHLLLEKDLELLSKQIDQCTSTLRNLTDKAEQTKSGHFPPESVRSYCEKIIERWQIIRPDVTAQITYTTNLPNITNLFHPTIEQAIVNLLNNAADAAPLNISIHIHWNHTQLMLEITDQGLGIPQNIAGRLGKPFFSTKQKGLGIGLFLSKGTINRYGGNVQLEKHLPQGTTTKISLPLYPELPKP